MRTINRLYPPRADADTRRAFDYLYDLIGSQGNGGGLGVSDEQLTRLLAKVRAETEQRATQLLGAFAQPLVGDTTSDPLLQSVAQAPGTGTVTSVAVAVPTQLAVVGSPITSTGTITISWNNQTANRILAGPATGAAAAPTFRALVQADLPAAAVQSTAGKTTAGAPYTNDGYVDATVNGVAVRLMTTA